MHRILSGHLPSPAFRSDSRRSSYPTRFAIAPDREYSIMVQRVFRALRDALPLIISAKHPILVCLGRRVEVDIKMSRHGLRNNWWRWDVHIGLAGVPDSVAASRVGTKRTLAHLVQGRGACVNRCSTIEG